MDDLSNVRVIVDRKAADGREIKVVAGISNVNGRVLMSYIDGVEDSGLLGPNYRIPAAIKARGFVAAVGRVPLTAEEAEAAEAAMAALKAERAATPDGLEDRRQYLVEKLVALRESAAAEREAAWEREDEAAGVTTPAEVAGEIAAASRAVRDFDAAHPEVVAAIKAADAAEARRRMWD